VLKVSIEETDIIVIGAGIAGASAAAEMADGARVLLLEMEPQPGYHATARSAAFFAAAYGKKVIRDITGCCENFFLNPPDGFSEAPLIRLRDCMFFGREDQAEQMNAMRADNPRLQFVDAAEVHRRCPVLKEDYLHGAMWDRMGGDLDVDALLQGFLRLFRRRGGLLKTQHEVTGLSHSGGRWRVAAGPETFSAPVVVNAAGAWADRVAVMAGLAPLGIRPLLRSALLIDPPPGMSVDDWPMMIDADEDFYFKPDAGQIMISPADETPTEPCDAQPDDFEIAVAVDRFERASGMDIRKVNHAWAGLRTFAPDRVFVAGADPRAGGFHWLAGQGGYGVQSAPAMAKMINWLVTGARPAGDFEPVLNYVETVSPERLL
jgi:D-arginine dehydrogenase